MPQIKLTIIVSLCERECRKVTPVARFGPTGAAERQEVEVVASCGCAIPVARKRANGATQRPAKDEICTIRNGIL